MFCPFVTLSLLSLLSLCARLVHVPQHHFLCLQAALSGVVTACGMVKQNRFSASLTVWKFQPVRLKEPAQSAQSVFRKNHGCIQGKLKAQCPPPHMALEKWSDILDALPWGNACLALQWQKSWLFSSRLPGKFADTLVWRYASQRVSRCSKLFYSIKVRRSHICRTLSRSYFPSVYQSLCPHSSIKQKENLPGDRAR